MTLQYFIGNKKLKNIELRRRAWNTGASIKKEWDNNLTVYYIGIFQGNWNPIVEDLLADDWERVKCDKKH